MQTTPEKYDCIIAHNLTDQLDAKDIPAPRILVIHLTLDGMIVEQGATTDPRTFRELVAEYVKRTSTYVVAVSALKGRSWGFPRDMVPLASNPADFGSHHGGEARGLRVSNFITRWARTLLWDFHAKVFEGLSVTLVGYNPELPGVRPAPDAAQGTVRHAGSKHLAGYWHRLRGVKGTAIIPAFRWREYYERSDRGAKRRTQPVLATSPTTQVRAHYAGPCPTNSLVTMVS